MATSPVVLVTGGSGWLGKFVLKELIARNFLVVNIDIAPLDFKHPSVESHIFDFRNILKLKEVTAAYEIHAIIHIASVIDVRIYPSPNVLSVNVQGTRALMEFSKHLQIPNFILVSSMDAGHSVESQSGVSEKNLPKCVNENFAYGYSKCKQEEIVMEFSIDNDKLKACALRVAHIFGPGDDLITIPWYIGISGGCIGLISVQNAAESIVNALEKIDVCNEKVIYLQDYAENIASFYSSRIGHCCILLPRQILYIFAWIFECIVIFMYVLFKVNLERHNKFVFNCYSVVQAGKPYFYDNSLSKEVGIYHPSVPFKQRLEEFEEWIKTQTS